MGNNTCIHTYTHIHKLKKILLKLRTEVNLLTNKQTQAWYRRSEPESPSLREENTLEKVSPEPQDCLSSFSLVLGSCSAWLGLEMTVGTGRYLLIIHDARSDLWSLVAWGALHTQGPLVEGLPGDAVV